ncbi:MAG: WYL domain-containing protein, partial [Myxococcales bacterium]|nr:WYL domain-containing protein [Myxococcales bacterium]
YQTLVKPPVEMSAGAVRVSGITPEMLQDAPRFPEVVHAVQGVLDKAVLVAHNAPHDIAFLRREMSGCGVDLGLPVALDTLEMSRRFFAFPRNSLSEVCDRLGIELQTHHRALSDARATFAAYHTMLDILDPDGRLTVGELDDLMAALAPNSNLRRRQERVLKEAFRARKSVWIEYINATDPRAGLSRREVAIWKLKMPRIQGFCYLRGDERVFRLDRMREVTPGDRDVEIPAFKARI